jgi:hypothetical protein
MKNLSLVVFMSLLLSSCIAKDFFSNSSVSHAICTPNKTIKHFAVYYGYPNSLNSTTNSWSNGLVISDLSRYESVLFGAGLEAAAHADHANTIAIIAGLTSTKSYGYIDIGNTLNKSIATIQTSIDNWAAMSGIYGIFLDEFGMDFKVGGTTDAAYRIRQKTILDYVHSKGLKAFMNAWDPDDVFIKEPTNPLTINSGDRYLYESYYLSSAARDTFANYRAKIAKLTAAKIAHPGLETMAVNTTSANTFTQGLFDTMALGAIADGIDGIAWGEANFSASAPMNAVMPFRTLPTQSNLYCIDQAASVNSASESLSFHTSDATITIQYNSSGSPSATITP